MTSIKAVKRDRGIIDPLQVMGKNIWKVSLKSTENCERSCRDKMVGWLFRVKRPFETVFQSISGRLPKRGRKRRERTEESKNVQTFPTRTYCKCSRPLPYCIPIVGRPGTGRLPSTIAPPDHPRGDKTYC